MEIAILERNGNWLIVLNKRRVHAGGNTGSRGRTARFRIDFDQCWSKEDGWQSSERPESRFESKEAAEDYLSEYREVLEEEAPTQQ